jgi:RNA polymerase sigma factor (sigma-70 family)
MEMSRIGPQLLARLLDEHGPALELFARQWCQNPADVVQDAFLQLIRQRTLPDNVAGWLYHVVRNGAITAARSTERRRRHETTAAQLHDHWFDPTSTVPLDTEAVTQSLAELPLDQRETIVAHLWGGLSFEQIAVLTDTSTSTAHRRYQAGLAALKKTLGAPCQKNRSTNES